MDTLNLAFKWYINAVVISIILFFTITSFDFILHSLIDVTFFHKSSINPATIITAIVSPILSIYTTMKNN